MRKVWILVFIIIELIYADVNRTIELRAGYNAVGFESNITIEYLIDKIGEENLLVVQGSGSGTTYKKSYLDNGEEFLNDFTQTAFGKGYWIHATEDVNFSYEPEMYYGIKKIDLFAGWNFISPIQELNVTIIKEQLGANNLLVIQGEGSDTTYKKAYEDNGEGFLNSFSTFEREKSYWIKVQTSGELIFEFDILDVVPPEITLHGDNNISLTQGEEYTELGVNVADNIDDNVTVVMHGTVDTSVVGTYVLTYTAIDDAGNETTITRTVNVLSNKRELPLLIIRIEFDDYQFEHSAEIWHQKIFGNNEGNLNHYYDEISYGKFAFLAAIETDGTHDGLITVQLTEDHPGNVNDFTTRLKDAIALADEYIDFSNYDMNENGSISNDELQIMFLVAGGESATGVIPGIWAHAWGFPSSKAPELDGVKVMSYSHDGGYSRFGEKHFELDGEDASIGIIAHELGHAAFDLPDLYDTDGSSEGIGVFGLMGAGSWGRQSGEEPGETPVHMTGWSKVKSNFIEAVSITENMIGVNLRATSFHDYILYRFETGRSGEYFLIENRANSGYDKGLYSLEGGGAYKGGLSILHIDDNQNDNDDETHKWVDIEEANRAGLDNASHQGHRENLFYSGNVDNFSTATTPNSDRYDGAESGLSISNISQRAASMSIDIEIN